MSLDFVDTPDSENVSHEFRLADYKDAIAASASLTTILQFLSGSLVCQKFIQKGSTSDVSSFPFVAGFLSCGLWLNYGMLLNDSFMVLVNSVGTILFMLYVFLFYMHTPRKNTVVRHVVLALAVLVCSRVYISWITDAAMATTHLGMIACSTSLVFFSAPLANLVYVFRKKSAESLPFPMIFMTFLVTFQWFLYGTILGNPIVKYPNLAGCLLSLFQLSLFMVFPR